jgi:hypothetical protein
MSRPIKDPEWLVGGAMFALTAAIGFYKFAVAYRQHAMIPYKAGTISPAQAFYGSILSLAVSFYCLGAWWRRQTK